MVYCAGLENRRAERLRGFESHPLRHKFCNAKSREWGSNAVRAARSATDCPQDSPKGKAKPKSIPPPPCLRVSNLYPVGGTPTSTRETRVLPSSPILLILFFLRFATVSVDSRAPARLIHRAPARWPQGASCGSLSPRRPALRFALRADLRQGVPFRIPHSAFQIGRRPKRMQRD